LYYLSKDVSAMNKFAKSILPIKLKSGFVNLLNPSIALLIKLKIHPNTFTVWGFIITTLSCYFLIIGRVTIGGIMILLGGICDIIDGKLARESGKVSRFGALFDSTVDRYSEVIMFFGVAAYYVRSDDYLTSVAVFMALGGSMMVSYVRSRAEGLGFECKVGLMQRPERVVFIGTGAIVGTYFNTLSLKVAIWIVALLSNTTAIQRIIHIYKADTNLKKPGQK
jgi:CDP-diacylglycerol--glycerol-3-phosphate 3-phosphatidyltransferase